jgi:hypothetical protein
MADFLDEKRRQIADRLKELEPLANEYHRLTAAASALEDAVSAAASAVADAAGSAAGSVRARVTGSTGHRGPGRPPGSTNKTASAAAPAKKPGRPPGRPKKVGRPPGSKKVGRPPGSTNKATAATATTTTAALARKGPSTGRRKGSGKRAAQALSLVNAHPGITIPELATKMGIKQNYLYRVMPALEKEGKLSKQGKGWYPKS